MPNFVPLTAIPAWCLTENPALTGATFAQQDLLRGVAMVPLDITDLFVGDISSFDLDAISDAFPAGVSVSNLGIVSGTPTETTLINELPVIRFRANGASSTVTHGGVTFAVTGPEIFELVIANDELVVSTNTGNGTVYAWFGVGPPPGDIDDAIINGTGALESYSAVVTPAGATISGVDLSAHAGTAGQFYVLQVAASGAYSNRVSIDYTPVSAVVVGFAEWGAAANTAGNQTSLIVPQPANVTAGDLLIANVSADGGPTLTGSTGWVKLGQDSQFTAVTGAAFSRVADGTAADTLTVTSTASEDMSGFMGRATGVSNVSATFGNNLGFNPPAHTPASNGLIWIGAAASDAQDAVTGAGANYTDFVTTSGGLSSSSRISCAVRELDAATEDPPAFVGGGGEQNVCWTIALW